MSKKYVTEAIISVLAIISIVLLAVESMVPVSEGALWGIYIADLVICIVFAADFIRRLRDSESRAHFLKTNGYEILAMIPAVALYAVGLIHTLSAAFRILRLFRVIIVMSRTGRAMSKSGGLFRRSHLLAMFGITACVIFIGAFAALVLDSSTENAQITNFSDAVWWSISTVTTVGYGDIVPRSIAGRIMGMILMVIGIGVMTAFISQISATLVESRLKRDMARKDDLRAAFVTQIKDRIDTIEKLSESEVALLVQMIHTLREGERKP